MKHENAINNAIEALWYARDALMSDDVPFMPLLVRKLEKAIDGLIALRDAVPDDLTDAKILEIAAQNRVKVKTGQTAIKFARAIIEEVKK